jgi:hypothetical protein
MRFTADSPSAVMGTSAQDADRSEGAARAISGFIDPGLQWSDIDWFKSITKSKNSATSRLLFSLIHSFPSATDSERRPKMGSQSIITSVLSGC